MRRGALAALAVASLTLSTAGSVRAASLWTLTATPLVATAGQSTTFHMLAANVLGPPAGCVNVEIPSSFVIQSAGNVVASDGSMWVAAVVGTWVEVTSVSGIDFLDPLESVSFDIQLVPTQAGTWNWNNHVHVSNQCTGTAYNGLPVTVVVEPAILPTPVPTPVPTPIPTAVPTVVPTLPPLPTPIPTLPPIPTLLPDPTATATPTPAATLRPSPSPTPQPVGFSPPSDPTGGASTVGRLADLAGPGIGSFGLGTDVIGLLDAPLVWFVPGAIVGVPGLLVLLWIALQAVGALAWIPAVRRMGGEPLAARRRRRRPAQA
ncbi:MAG TPA: hypothetical protein VMK30_02960 [Pleomorphomonadaceae bacterium]|nr:hypothetical protein [Pleomorphomonadaceae bacterium]